MSELGLDGRGLWFTDAGTKRRNEKAAAATQPELTVESAIEQAKRAFALRKYEQAVELYGSALELLYVLPLLHAFVVLLV